MPSKKDPILEAYQSGTKDLLAIANQVHVQPSYVASVLRDNQHEKGVVEYHDIRKPKHPSQERPNRES
jgi:hypothetical protein